MPLPTQNDIISGLHVIQRILLRKNFEKLKSRQGSKYFENIIVSDIPWGTITPIPTNFPQEFKNKYPYDFDVQFTTKGCNMLKCYKHDYNNKNFSCKNNPHYPQFINGYIFACSEACYGVYDEFDSFLMEQFRIRTKYIAGGVDELWFETTSIEQKKQQQRYNKNDISIANGGENNVNRVDNNNISDSNCFCGIQLTDLKRYAILPSSRWIDTDANDDEEEGVENDNNAGERNITGIRQNDYNLEALNNNDIPSSSSSSKFLTSQKYFDIYLNKPMKLCDIAGLVDAPPLMWDKKYQNVNFNEEYCRRFRKYYDSKGDVCKKYTHRKVLGHLLGENVVNQFSDTDFLFSLPIDFLVKSSTSAHGILEFPFNLGYEEKKISQKKLEAALFIDIPDRIINNTIETVEIIRPNDEGLPYTLGYYKNSISEEISYDMGRAILDILKAMAEETAIEESISSSPILISYLLRTYSQKFLNRAITIITTRANLIPASVRISMLFLRTIITQVWVQMAVKVLTFISTSASVVTALGIFTIIPEILLTHYNIGGYNREITREQLEMQREECMNNTLKQMLKMKQEEEKSGNAKKLLLSPLSYISISSKLKSSKPSSLSSSTSSSFVSPLITPEFVYNLCLINFHKHNPDCIVDIGFVGLNPDDEMNLLEEYISLLKVNSAGQHIILNSDDDNNTSPSSTTTTTTTNDAVIAGAKSSSSLTNALEEILLNNGSQTPTRRKNNHYRGNSSLHISSSNDIYNIIEAESVLNNMANRIDEKINDVSFDAKSTDTISRMVGFNKDIYLLIFGLAIVLFMCGVLFLFFCNHCTFYNVNFFSCKTVISLLIIILYVGTYTLWFTIFKPNIIKARD